MRVIARSSADIARSNTIAAAPLPARRQNVHCTAHRTHRRLRSFRSPCTRKKTPPPPCPTTMIKRRSAKSTRTQNAIHVARAKKIGEIFSVVARFLRRSKIPWDTNFIGPSIIVSGSEGYSGFREKSCKSVMNDRRQGGPRCWLRGDCDRARGHVPNPECASFPQGQWVRRRSKSYLSLHSTHTRVIRPYPERNCVRLQEACSRAAT